MQTSGGTVDQAAAWLGGVLRAEEQRAQYVGTVKPGEVRTQSSSQARLLSIVRAEQRVLERCISIILNTRVDETLPADAVDVAENVIVDLAWGWRHLPGYDPAWTPEGLPREG